jgi:hypothetical protein
MLRKFFKVLNNWLSVPDPKILVTDPVPRILDSDPRILNPDSRILNPDSRILNPVYLQYLSYDSTLNYSCKEVRYSLFGKTLWTSGFLNGDLLIALIFYFLV